MQMGLHSRASACIDDSRKFFGMPFFNLLHLIPVHQLVPRIEFQSIRTQGKRDALHAFRNAFFHLLPGIPTQLAHEQQFRLGMFKRVLRCFDRQRGIDGDTNMTGKHNGQIGHDPPRTISGHNRNLTWDRQVKGFNVCGHPLGFRYEVCKSPRPDFVANGLGQEDLVRMLGALVQNVVGDDLAGFFLGDFRRHDEFVWIGWFMKL